MPEPREQEGVDDDKRCARCHASNAALVVRSECLCRDCFMKYVGGKLMKRLEMNKIRGGFHEAQKTLLVPIDFDVSSICLLHALDQQLQKRMEAGRHAGYTLQILCFDESCVRQSSNIQKILPLLEQRFPDYTSRIISLDECFSYGIDLEPLMSEPIGGSTHQVQGNPDRLQIMLSNLPSATSKADVIDILRRRLTAAYAKKNGCDSILYGDSTTSLAERTLSETAKGRGGALPWLTSDNTTISGVPCIFPMRDLLQKELALYSQVTHPSLTPLIRPPDSRSGNVSSKDSTIDQLMSQYFQSLEENFPSIVANVVRTSSKLAAREKIDQGQACELCKLPVSDADLGGQQSSLAPEEQPSIGVTRSSHRLCYGCARTLQTP